MKSTERKLTCMTTDYVESDLEMETRAYTAAGIIFRPCQLRKAPAKELISAAADADVLVVDQAQITAEVLEGLPNCKLVIRHGDGYDNLDFKAAAKLGIACANEPGFWSREVAEQAFAMALSAAFRLPIQQEVARNPRTGEGAGWDLQKAMPFRSLGSLTVGVVGCGKIGAHAVRLFAGVAKQVLVHDPYIDPARIRECGGQPATLETLLAQSDIVSLHTPMQEETRGLFNAARLAAMKPGAILVNTARGPIVDTDAAADAVASGHLAGLALDTTDPEPLNADHRLHGLPNVLITPHMGWYSETALTAMREQIIEDVKGIAEGRLPKSIVNPEVLGSPLLRMKDL